MCGELLHQHIKNQATIEKPEENLVEYFHNIAFATSFLTFENIKFMTLDKSFLKILIVNVNEETIIVGIDKQASWSNIFDIAPLFN